MRRICNLLCTIGTQISYDFISLIKNFPKLLKIKLSLKNSTRIVHNGIKLCFLSEKKKKQKKVRDKNL